MPAAAALTVLLEILEPVESETDEAGTLRAWEARGRLWAEVTPLGGAERLVGEGTQAIVSHEITFRADPRVAPKDRLHDAGTGRTYHVEAVVTAERARFHVARCREVRD